MIIHTDIKCIEVYLHTFPNILMNVKYDFKLLREDKTQIIVHINIMTYSIIEKFVSCKAKIAHEYMLNIAKNILEDI